MLTERVHTGEMLRFFDLPEAQGGRITSRQFRGRRNLVLFFMDSVLCGECRDKLKELAGGYASIREQEGEFLVILLANKETAQALKEEFRLRNPVLYDENGDTFLTFGAIDESRNPASAVIVTDRFGEIYYSSLSGETEKLPSVKEIIEWLEFVEVQCPE